jgi:hypothetical protein
MNPDFLIAREFFGISLDVSSRKIVAKAFVILAVSQKTICYFLSSIICAYFQTVTNESIILRKDSFLTNCLSAIRELYCDEFFEQLAEKVFSCLKGNENQIYESFLHIIDNIEFPLILRWICWLLVTEAKTFFPNGNVHFQAVTGFLFLRGLGTYVDTFQDKDTLSNFKSLKNLLNFSKKISEQSYIEQFKDCLAKISVEVDQNDLFPLLNEVEQNHENYLIDFLNNLVKNKYTVYRNLRIFRR